LRSFGFRRIASAREYIFRDVKIRPDRNLGPSRHWTANDEATQANLISQWPKRVRLNGVANAIDIKLDYAMQP